MNDFYIVMWKQFEKRKLLDYIDIVKGEDSKLLLEQFKKLNAQKRLTTTDYAVFNLTKLFADHSLSISEEVKSD